MEEAVGEAERGEGGELWLAYKMNKNFKMKKSQNLKNRRVGFWFSLLSHNPEKEENVSQLISLLSFIFTDGSLKMLP